MSPPDQPRILFVDDDPEVRVLLHQMLEGTYDLALAADAEEALRILENEEFDLFLLDIRLGEGRSGTELLHLLRDLEPTASVPAVALTTHGLEGDREALLAEGFDEHVSKPFLREDITQAINQILLDRPPSARRR